ncbi:unnamed protein product [Rhizopus stolonifer]
MFRLSRVCHPNLNLKAVSHIPPLPRVQSVRQYTVSSKLIKQNHVNTPVSIAASKILPLTAFSTVSMSLFLKKPAHCEAAYANPIQVNQLAPTQTRQPLFRKGELTFGTFLGLCTGFLIKKVGKLFAAFVGTMFVFIQYLSGEGYVTVNWDRFENRYTKVLDTDKDGKVSTKDIQSKWKKFINILTNNIQFKSTFLAGFYVGLRYG